jgi:hypothetical protein
METPPPVASDEARRVGNLDNIHIEEIMMAVSHPSCYQAGRHSMAPSWGRPE